jgi:DUF4097 and DUF4098 domain-containing protein YvlB
MASATLQKVAILEEQNLMVLMMTLDSTVMDLTAQKYFQLRRHEELEKLEERLAEAAAKKVAVHLAKQLEIEEQLAKDQEAELQNVETARQMHEQVSERGHKDDNQDNDYEDEDHDVDLDSNYLNQGSWPSGFSQGTFYKI